MNTSPCLVQFLESFCGQGLMLQGAGFEFEGIDDFN